MKQELDRIKSDMAVIQQAMGLVPVIRHDWLQWMKRDRWMSLWWCLPGVILIASSLLPVPANQRFFGLVASQWSGITVSIVMLLIMTASMRQMSRKEGRPESLVQEYRRINGLTAHGTWVNVSIGVGLAFYFLWAKQHQIGFGAFWSGLFVFTGSCLLATAMAAKAWLLLGWALPFLAYGLFLTLAPAGGALSGIPLGLMFIAVALSFSVIQVLEIRRLEARHDSD